MSDISYTHIVSLGAWCQVASQIKTCTGDIASGPFDWLVTPLPALIRILREDAQGLALAAIAEDDTAICPTYGCLYHHEFERDAARRCIITDEALARTRSKLLHKWESLKQKLSDGQRTLFVRFGGDGRPARAWPYHVDPHRTCSAELNALDDALAERFPGMDFDILHVWHEQMHPSDFSAPLSPRIRLAPMTTPSHRDWRGDAMAWQALFDRHGVATLPQAIPQAA